MEKPPRSDVPMRMQRTTNPFNPLRVAQESIAARINAKLKAKQTELVRSENALGQALIQNQDIRYELESTPKKEELKDGEFELKLSEQKLQRLDVRGKLFKAEQEHAALITPTIPVPSELDQIRAENQRLQAEVEQIELRMKNERLKAQLRELSNPHRPDPPKPETPSDRHAREFAEREERKSKIRMAAEQNAEKYPQDREYIMRQAQKEIEALSERV